MMDIMRCFQDMVFIEQQQIIDLDFNEILNLGLFC